MKFEIADAGGAAWRARYVYLNGRKIAHIGVDPCSGVTPILFGSINGKDFRFRLPTVRWKYPCSKRYMRAYKLSQWFWHGVDGRYGWHGSCVKR